MTPKAILTEILQLPLDERLKLVEDIWDSIAATPSACMRPCRAAARPAVE